MFNFVLVFTFRYFSHEVLTEEQEVRSSGLLVHLEEMTRGGGRWERDPLSWTQKQGCVEGELPAHGAGVEAVTVYSRFQLHPNEEVSGC